MNAACPQCQQPLAIPASAAGQTVACPKCHAQIKIPGDSTAPAAGTAAVFAAPPSLSPTNAAPLAIPMSYPVATIASAYSPVQRASQQWKLTTRAAFCLGGVAGIVVGCLFTLIIFNIKDDISRERRSREELLEKPLRGSGAGAGGTASSAANGKVDFADFIDHTDKYKGRTFTINLKIFESMRKGESLQDYVGQDVKFYTFGPKHEHMDIIISIPNGLSVPKAVFLDNVEVEFHCKDGSLQSGNEAKSIVRP